MKGIHGRSQLVRWRLVPWFFSNRVRLLVCLGLLFVVSFFVGRLSSIMGWSHASHLPELPESRERMTILINTWRRQNLLKKSVTHYSSCSCIDAIRVVWSEAEPPSESLKASLQRSIERNTRRSGSQIELWWDTHGEDNLNNRFKPLNGLRTDAVFSVDDDVVVPCETLKFGFTVWASARDSMVGFVPRMNWVEYKKREQNEPHYTYGGWWSVWWTGTYSMVLTKAAFFHRKYLQLYTYHMPAEFRDYVARERNCEDLAMSFLVANVSRAAPIWVKGRIYEIGSTGISSLKGHNKHRTACLNKFASMYGEMPLVPSRVKAIDALGEWFW